MLSLLLTNSCSSVQESKKMKSDKILYLDRFVRFKREKKEHLNLKKEEE